MPGLDATQVRVGTTGRVLVAPVGTTAPVDAVSAWPAGWIDLGYVDDKNTALKPINQAKDIFALQTLFPVRSIVTQRGLELFFELLQHTGTNLKLALGGGNVAQSGTTYTFTPPTTSQVDERALGLEIQDGTNVDRWVLPRGIVVALKDIIVMREDAVRLGVTFRVLQPQSGPFYSLISNDPNFNV